MQRVSRCIVWCFAVHCSQFSPANLCGLDKYMPWVNVFRLAHGLVLFNRFHFISSDERRLRELNLGLFLIYDRGATAMAFCVVETHGPKGHGELSAVPSSWVQGTSSGKTYLLWPNQNIRDISTLLCDAESVPSKGWSRQQCIMKRNNIQNYADATKIMAEMSGDSSSDYEAMAAAKKKVPSYKDMFSQKALENINHTIEDSVIESNECKESEYLDMLGDVTHTEEEWLMHQEGIEGNCQRCKTFREEEKWALQQLLEGQQKMFKRLGVIERQLDVILNSHNKHQTTTANRAFQTISNEEDLDCFNIKLVNEEYFEEVVTNLISLVSDIDPESRMLSTLDLIFDKEFLTTCSWTGVGKSCSKIPIIAYKNVQKLFQRVGSTQNVVVSDESVTQFFMKKLKHAKQRFLNIQGIRKPTSHKKTKKYFIDENDNIC
ncbi:uncharacterized protein LOC121597386 isoform X2 [Anopheles merus]|uniref:uncharacterized protein LOC121597386 isoform X2 n=1 Tax=Anopheles merus TaxID=30066 RepID=UPI001BE3F730|nr:uncharacterized protein LOC121597386 isoform X2 [Anopheles merus]